MSGFENNTPVCRSVFKDGQAMPSRDLFFRKWEEAIRRAESARAGGENI